LRGQKMPDSNQITLNPVVSSADPQRVLPDGTSEIAGANLLAEPSLRRSRELAVSRRDLLSFRTNHLAMPFSRLDEDPYLREAQFKLCVNHL